MATPSSSIFLLTVIAVFAQTSVKCSIFENVNVSLTSRWAKLFFHGQPPKEDIYIESSNTLADYVNLQPLEIVTIYDQEIEELKENSLANMPNVVELYINVCRVKKIEPGTFGNVPRLDIVDLGKNILEEIEDGVFANLELKILYLHHNKIEKLGANAFNNMTQLQSIILSYNKISTWTSDWFIGTPVTNVYMAYNQIEELPANTFGFLFQYKRANVPLTIWNFVLSSNKLKKVDQNAFLHVNAFGTFSLGNNHLKDLPENLFKSVKNVNLLDLSNNNISSVTGLFDDINIVHLNLDKNRLSCFPTDIFDVSRIENVHVGKNPFTCDCVEHWKMWQRRNGVLVINLKYLKSKCVNEV